MKIKNGNAIRNRRFRMHQFNIKSRLFRPRTLQFSIPRFPNAMFSLEIVSAPPSKIVWRLISVQLPAKQRVSKIREFGNKRSSSCFSRERRDVASEGEKSGDRKSGSLSTSLPSPFTAFSVLLSWTRGWRLAASTGVPLIEPNEWLDRRFWRPMRARPSTY